jgi:hypothetical protein
MTVFAHESFSLADVAYLYDGQGLKQGDDVLLASGQTSSITPNHRIPRGTVVVKKTSTGKYYLADDASNGDRNTGAVVTASETADADWKSKTITLTINGREVVTVTLGAGDDTDAEVKDALNADATFKLWAVASVAGSRVVITSLQTGADVVMKITSNLSTAFGANGTSAQGVDADYRVTHLPVDLKDLNAAAVDGTVPTVVAGRFRSSVLSNATAEAKAVLTRRGSQFL